MKYVVVKNDSLFELQQEVNQALQDGWKLHGGICATNDGGNSLRVIYLQAIVKDE